MKYGNDIFISYAHLDDSPIIEGELGWVSCFHQSLGAFVAQYLGKKPKIWRDLKLQGNGRFGPEIIDQLKNAALLVSIISPRYLESDWCQQEINAFLEIAKQTQVNGSAEKRVFKVVKYPCSSDQSLPTVLNEILGYEFFEIDPMDEEPRDIRPEFGPEFKQKYLQRIAELARQIKKQLASINEDEATMDGEVSKCELKSKVYLATTTLDLDDERENIRQELEQLGYSVLPRYPLEYGPDFCQKVADYLGQCSLSIHLLGRRFGIVPEGEEQSIVALQRQLALSQTQSDPNFSHLVWMPPDLQIQEPRQRQFIQTVLNDADLIKTNLESLKTIIQEKLSDHQPSSALQQEQTDGLTRIYFIYDQTDEEDIVSIVDYLFEMGYEVIEPWFGEDETQVRQEHQESLNLCDAVLLYYGNGDQRWLREQMRYLQKIERSGDRIQSIRAKAILVSDPATPAKGRFRTREAIVLRCIWDFEPAVLEEFIGQLASPLRGYEI